MKNVLLACFAIVGSTASLRADIIVTPSSMGDWAFTFLETPDGGNTYNSCASCQVGSMVAGPATPPLGVGSANLQTTAGKGDGAASIAYSGINGTALSSLTALSYSTYDATNNGQQFPYLELHISYNGGADFDSLFFEPPYQTPTTGDSSLPTQGDPVMNQWQTWNALAGGWWDNNGLANPGTGVLPFSTFLAAYPDAVIVGSSYFANDGLNLTVGFASDTDNFNGNVDNVTVGVNGVNTVFDFEPNTSVPEPSSVLLLATMLVGIGLGIRGKKRFRA